MTDLPQRQTMSYGSKGNRGLWPLDTPPPADNVSFDPGLVGRQFGWVKVTSPERRYTRGWAGAYVATECTNCGHAQWTALANLSQGKSMGCQPCSQPQSVPKWLLKRVTSMRSRCTNPKDAGYARYGGRGITFDFPSVLEGALWIQENLGLDRLKELDRVDNNLGYRPGNLRYATKSQNSRNQRRSKLQVEDSVWAATESPLGYYATTRYLRSGYPKEAIVGVAYAAVLQKRKNWRTIRDRLAALGYTTSSTPGLETGSP